MHGEILTVILPGLDGTGDLLHGFSSAAPPQFTPLVLPYPRDRELGYDELEEYLASVLPRQNNLVLVGESFGGALAIRLSRRSGVSARAVVLCNSFVSPPRRPALRHLARTFVFGVRLPQPILAAFMLSPFATPKLTAQFAKAISSVPAKVIAHRVRQLLAVDERERLRTGASKPTLYLRGTHDRLVPQRAVDQVVASLPNTVVAKIAAPHAVLQTAPAEAWKHIESFLATAAG